MSFVKFPQVGDSSDAGWRAPPADAGSHRFTSGQGFRYALPGPSFADFNGPGGQTAKAGNGDSKL